MKDRPVRDGDAGERDEGVKHWGAKDKSSGDGRAPDESLRAETDEVWRRDEVDSPCVKLCVVHPEARLCIGCLRTIEEITGWGRMTPAARAAITEALPARAPQVAHRRGGRAARLSR